ncbi:hypothetical protein ACQP2F_32875 [Actinoplanes sp. CA-030573]|uniref:hypothetical protein n=1 Tax=Actinoplanes sp. CA-030573 TaxID=3239898 RepID=UPI003D941921
MDVDRQPPPVISTPGLFETTGTLGVLLVDLENMVGCNAKPRSVAARMQVLIRCAGPRVKVVAACARGRITPDGEKVLHEHDVALLTVDGAKDAADEALLAEAYRLAGTGCRRFIVASNDSTFARLATIGDLEIVIWTTQTPRENYTGRASQVHRLPLPTSAAPSSTALAGRPENAASATMTGRRSTRPPSTPPPVASTRCARLVSAGAGLVAAGVLFGVGAALGDLAVRRLPCYPNRPR